MQKKILVAAVLVVFALSGFVFFYGDRLRELAIPGGTLSISNITVKVENPDDPNTKEYEGSYWLITALTNTEFGYQTYTFNKEESQKSYSSSNTSDGKKLEPTAGVKIKIIPQQPYYEVPLQYYPDHLVSPKTYGAWISKLGGGYGKRTDISTPELKVSYWLLTGVWSWTLHTPFRVELYKNDQLLDAKDVDTYGKSLTQWLQNPNDSKEKMSVADLGKIGTGYNPPSNPNLLIFNREHIYEATQSLDDIEYDKTSTCYASYWWNPKKGRVSGLNRWSDDGSPRPFDASTSVDDNHPGWIKNDDALNFRWKVNPPPDPFSNSPSGGLGLINYLIQQRGMKKVDFSGVEWLQGLEITSDNKLRAYLPKGSSSSLITIAISTELADTVVVSIPIAIPQITSAKWLSTGTTSGSRIGDRDKILVTVKNTASVRGTISLSGEKSPSTAPISLSPIADQDEIDAGKERTFEFTVICLGASEDTSFSIKFKAYDSAGTEKSSITLSGTQLKRGQATATLLVYTLEAETKEKLSGIYVTVAWDSQSKGQYTSAGSTTFDMGSFQGTITVSSSETPTYKSASTSVNIKSGQENVAYLYLVRQGAPQPFPWWIIILIVVVVVVVTLVWWWWKKR